MNIFIDALIRRDKLRRSLRDKLDSELMVRAEKDWHAKRRPRQCGLTIHTGVGCPYQCSYCYIYSMGFPRRISRYPLPPLGVIYAILSNQYFIPGKYGTFLALGSVTEPFHPLTKKYTIKLIQNVKRILGNPTQVSTKAYISDEDARDLVDTDPEISILYTVTTIKYFKELEEYAPTPSKRFESMEYLTSRGLHTTLFIRPIIPGITDIDNLEILRLGRYAGVDKVVYGTLRVNRDILSSLMRKLDRKVIDKIVRGLNVKKLSNKQIYIKALDIKNRLIREAMDMGFKVYPSACSANIDSIRLSCYMCKFGPCGDINNLPAIDESDILDLMEYLGITAKRVKISIMDNIIEIYGYDREFKDRSFELKNVIKTISKRDVAIRYKH